MDGEYVKDTHWEERELGNWCEEVMKKEEGLRGIRLKMREKKMLWKG